MKGGHLSVLRPAVVSTAELEYYRPSTRLVKKMRGFDKPARTGQREVTAGPVRHDGDYAVL